MFGKNPFEEYRATQKTVQEKKVIDPQAPIDGGTQIDPDGAIQESKFVIPEEIPANERTAFHGAAAAAAKAGKTHFNFGGKKHPVTMKKDTANAIADQKEDTKLDELSPSTLKSYSNKAKKQAIGLSQKGDKKDLKKFGNRIKGISQADDKMKEGYMKDLDTEKSEPTPRSDKKVAADFKKRRKGEKNEVEMNPKLDSGKKEKAMETKESRIRSALKSVLSEKKNEKDKHTKGATEPEGMMDKQQHSAAKEMMKAADAEIAKGPDAHLNEPEIDKKNFEKMTSNVKNAKMRSNDNPKGDRKIVPGGTQFKDPAAMKAESYNKNVDIIDAYKSMYKKDEEIEESYTHEFDYAEDGKNTAKSFVDKAKKAGIKAKIHSDRGPGGGHPVVHLGHKDTKHMHSFLKKHYDPDMAHDDLDAHKI